MSSFTVQRITAQDAEREPEVDRLFGPAYDARQRALRRAAGRVVVANIRTTKVGEYIGRAMPHQGLAGSPLGNPYRLGPNEPRGIVIERYRQWLERQMASDTPARRELHRLARLAQDGELTLLCWCAPLACHGDVVRDTILATCQKYYGGV